MFYENCEADATIWSAIITSLVIAIGWFITKEFENEHKENEEKLSFVQRQIEEFYGPLYNITKQIENYGKVLKKLKQTKKSSPKDIDMYFHVNYFVKLHKEILEILKHKYHLVSEDHTKDVFDNYMRYVLQLIAQIEMYKYENIETDDIDNNGSDIEFNKFVDEGLSEAEKRRSKILNRKKMRFL